MNKDLFANAGVREVASGSMAIISRIQDMQPHVQMASIASTFLLLCEFWKLPAQEAFTVVKNIMNNAEGRRPEFAAVRQYMENEL